MLPEAAPKLPEALPDVVPLPVVPAVVPVAVPPAVLPVVPLEVVPLVALGTFVPAVGGLLGRAGTAGTVKAGEVPVAAEFAGGVITTVEPVEPLVPPIVLPVVPVVVPTAGALRTPPVSPGRIQVTSRFVQKSGIELRSADASAALDVDIDPPARAAATAKKISLRVIM